MVFVLFTISRSLNLKSATDPISIENSLSAEIGQVTNFRGLKLDQWLILVMEIGSLNGPLILLLGKKPHQPGVKFILVCYSIHGCQVQCKLYIFSLYKLNKLNIKYKQICRHTTSPRPPPASKTESPVIFLLNHLPQIQVFWAH